MEKWMEDINMAIVLAETINGPTSDRLASSLTDNKSLTEDSCAEAESEDDLMASRTSLERQAPHRGNTTVHVCWHRNTSVSMVDFSIAVEVPAPALTCPALASPGSVSLSVYVSISECVSSPGNSVLLSHALSVMALWCYLDIMLPQ
uniref:PH domain-containing protein n=1 Tax=Hucho hucho TaxID=62062 RepID=A0A4W5LJ81_9TELE